MTARVPILTPDCLGAVYLIPCNHTFCGHCLEDVIKYNDKCPECRESFVVARNDFKIKKRVESFLEQYPDMRRKDMTMDEIGQASRRIGKELHVGDSKAGSGPPGSATDSIKKDSAALLDDVEQQKQAVGPLAGPSPSPASKGGYQRELSEDSLTRAQWVAMGLQFVPAVGGRAGRSSRDSLLSQSSAYLMPGLLQEQVMFAGREICDGAGAVRVRIPSGGVSVTLCDEEWHKGLDLIALVVPVTEEMCTAASSAVNVLLGGGRSAIVFAGAAIKFGPSGTRFEPKVTLVLPLSKRFLEDLSNDHVKAEFGAFRWNGEQGRWEQVAGDEQMDFDEGSLSVESEGFSTWVVGLVVAALAGAGTIAGCQIIGSGPSRAQFGGSSPAEAVRGGDFHVHVIAYSCSDEQEVQGRKKLAEQRGHEWFQSCAALGRPDELLFELQSLSPRSFTVKAGGGRKKWDGQMTNVPFTVSCEKQALVDVPKGLRALIKTKEGDQHEIHFSVKPQAAANDQEPHDHIAHFARQHALASSHVQWSSSQPMPSPSMHHAFPMSAGTSSPRSVESGVMSPVFSGASAAMVVQHKWKVIFFSCRCGTTIDPERECQDFKDLLRKHRSVFTFDSYPRPEIKHFTDELRDTHTSAEKERLVLHFSGHASGSTGGLYWFSQAGKKVKENQVTGEHLANLIEINNQHGLMERIDCFFLNACSTLATGLALCRRGVKVVICWQTTIKQSIARGFAFRFYEFLIESPGDYSSAFATVCNEMVQELSNVSPCILHSGEPGKVGSVQVWRGSENMMGGMVSLSLDDQELFLQVSLASQVSGSSEEEVDEMLAGDDDSDDDDDGEEDPEKNWNTPKNPFDFAAHAGLAEQSLLSNLGFDISMIAKDQKGMVTPASWKAMGVGSYSALWGCSGKIVKKAEALLTSSQSQSDSAPRQVGMAISYLERCIYYRQMDVLVYRMKNGKMWSKKEFTDCKQKLLTKPRGEIMNTFHDDVRDRNILKQGGILNATKMQELQGACQSHLFELDRRSETCDALKRVLDESVDALEAQVQVLSMK